MEITYFHKNVSEAEEKFFLQYSETKIDAILSLLTKFSDDAKILKVSLEKFEKHDAFEAEFFLALPSKTLIAREASHSITKAVDLAKDRLITQIKKHLAALRKERAHKTIRRDEELTKEKAYLQSLK